MSDDYQVRKDLNRVINLANQLEEALANSGVNTLSELLSKYYDSSDVDVKNWKLNDDLEDTTAIAEGAENKATTANSRATEVRKVLFSGNSDTGTSGNPASGTVKANLNTAQSDISDVQTDIGTVNVSSDGNLQSQINNIYQYEITPILQYGSSTERVTTNFLSNSSMYFKVKAYTRTGTPITTDELTATLMTPRGDVSLTPSKPLPTTDPEIYLFSYFNTGIGYNESGVYVFQIGDASLTCIVEKDTDFDRIYPIGSIYISVNDLNPQYIFGGTWQQLEDTFLFATSGTADTGYQATAGSKDAVVVSHSHTQNSHNHDATNSRKFLTVPSNWDVVVTAAKQMQSSTGSSRYFYTETSGGQVGEYAETTSVSPTINSNGVAGTDKNMPPYMKVYMWKRTG